MSSILTCNEDCFHCIYPDCIMDVLPSERNRINVYRQKHKEEIRAYQKKYYQEHKEEIRACQKKYRQEHKEKIKAHKKIYYQEHKEEIIEKQQKNYI